MLRRHVGGGRDVDTANAEIGGALLEAVTGEHPRRVSSLELARGEVEQGNAGVAQSRQMRQARLYGFGEIQVHVTDPRRVARTTDQHERATLGLESLHSGIIEQCLHQDDAVGAPPATSCAIVSGSAATVESSSP